MTTLFPVFDVPKLLPEDAQTKQKYKKSPLFDIEKGDFVLDGAKHPIYGNGYQAWVLWCMKTIMTQRYAHMSYSSNIGIELSEAFAEADAAAVQVSLERSITEALLADPESRTQYVRDFKFSFLSDELYAECIVVGSDGNSASIKVRLNAKS